MAGTQGLECYRPRTREEIQSPQLALQFRLCESGKCRTGLS
jgi:hypothetical protein